MPWCFSLHSFAVNQWPSNDGGLGLSAIAFSEGWVPMFGTEGFLFDPIFFCFQKETHAQCPSLFKQSNGARLCAE